MRLPSGGVLMGFCKLRSSCPPHPAPAPARTIHNPWSSILFVIFGHLAGALCLGGLRRPGARIIRSWARTGGNKVPAPAGGARWMVVFFDWVRYSFLSIYSLWVTVPQVLHSRHEMLVVIITKEHEDYKHQASETHRASQKRRVHLVKWPLTEEFFTNPADKGYFIMNQM